MQEREGEEEGPALFFFLLWENSSGLSFPFVAVEKGIEEREIEEVEKGRIHLFRHCFALPSIPYSEVIACASLLE